MTEIDKDLDVAIGHYAELLASNLHAQRAAHFPPDAKKVMRSLTSGEAITPTFANFIGKARSRTSRRRPVAIAATPSTMSGRSGTASRPMPRSREPTCLVGAKGTSCRSFPL